LDNRVLVKEQIKTTAQESRTIRAAEARQRKNMEWAWEHEAPEQFAEAAHAFGSLQYYRRVNLRQSSRALQLAYAYMRGRSYRSVEPYSNDQPDWDFVKAHIRDGDVPYDGQAFGAWRTEPERPRPVREQRLRPALICGEMRPGIGCGELTNGHFTIAEIPFCHRCVFKTGLFDETPNGYVRREAA